MGRWAGNKANPASIELNWLKAELGNNQNNLMHENLIQINTSYGLIVLLVAMSKYERKICDHFTRYSSIVPPLTSSNFWNDLCSVSAQFPNSQLFYKYFHEKGGTHWPPV